MATPAPALKKPAHPAGLEHWMRRVPEECTAAAREFAPDPVHDLRVALRRCRSLAGGLMAVDPHPAWRSMRKAGRKLFRSLGGLRDVHVLIEWIEKLGPANDSARSRLIPLLRAEEERLKAQALTALAGFDRAHWAKWTHTLPVRASRLPLDSPAFQHLALERWHEARDLHRAALRTRSQVAWHRLRIGLKRFRYTIENFLPSRAAWLRDLKQLQDALGDVHDLDVLAGRYFTRTTMFDQPTRAAWLRRIRTERDQRLTFYRSKMTGSGNLWNVWRNGLPEAAGLQAAALAKLRAWASFTDPRFAQSQHVARLALQLFDGFAPLHLLPRRGNARARRILQAAALLRDVGRAAARKKHGKAAYKLIRRFEVPFGWSRQQLHRTALVARYHRGAEPRLQHGPFARLSPPAQRQVAYLAGLLRLADALGQPEAGPVSALRVSSGSEAATVLALGLRESLPAARLLGGRKHLLEAIVGRPVVVRPWQVGAQRQRRQLRRGR